MRTNGCSVLDGGVAWTPSLFDTEPVVADDTFTGARRIELAHDAWVDHTPGWLHGAAQVFDDLVANVPWKAGRRLMYGTFVDEPRLHAYRREAVASCAVARPVIDRMATLLSKRFRVLLPNVGLNYYRDGRDSVAWHGDTVGRQLTQTTVAIVSVGGARPFRLRPRTGGETIEFLLGSGDLLVMGGSCQRTWYHSVPKVRDAPPRISITYRPKGVS
jgi:alkylated DNA repair dioxygenase AlkB